MTSPEKNTQPWKSINPGIILGPFLFLLTRLFFHPEGLNPEANAVLASALWIAIWWITEAVPFPVTSLLPIILFPLTGGLSLEETTVSYGHKYIFLYIGGFILAIAIERWNLHRRIALNIIHLIGTDIKHIILGFMVATAFLSMWISNTAAAVMMLPIGVAIVSQLKDDPDTIENENLTFGKALMIGIAASASIGGLGTLIGTAPTLVLAGFVEETYGLEITFAQWIVIGLPLSVTLLLITWKYITSLAFRFERNAFPGGKEQIRHQLRLLGQLTVEERLVLVVFAVTALGWITRSLVFQKIIPGLDDTAIAVIAGISLFLLPAGKEKKRTLVTWEEAVKLPWGVLLLFGGGLALAEGFRTSGLADWIGQHLSLLQGASLLLVILVLVTAVNFLTEITSNLATTAMILPVLAPVAAAIGVHPYLLMVSATIAASCAFMLPVATPPNAVVFGSGYLKIPDMVRVGIGLNILSILVVALAIYFLLPLIWGFDPFVVPEKFTN